MTTGTEIFIPEQKFVKLPQRIRDSMLVPKFVVTSGPRGSGKSLLMTGLACEQLVRTLYLWERYGIKRGVWSNYEISFCWQSEITGKIYKIEAQPLDMEALYFFDSGLANGWIYIDEIDQWFDRQSWNTTSSKLIHKALTQIRKKQLSVCSTIQDFEWLNARGLFQIDIQIGCREAAFTPWGREHHVKLGEITFLACRDFSGVATGYMYRETERVYDGEFHGKNFWHCYDTNKQYDPVESSTRVVIERPEKKFRLDETGYHAVDGEGDGQNHSELSILRQLRDSLLGSGVRKIATDELWGKAYAMGFQSDMGPGAKLLIRLGVIKEKNDYLLAGREGVNSPQTLKNNNKKKQPVKAGKK